MHQVTLIPGDGIGPEVAAAARAVVDASGAQIEWHVCPAGEAQMAASGTPLPGGRWSLSAATAWRSRGPSPHLWARASAV